MKSFSEGIKHSIFERRMDYAMKVDHNTLKPALAIVFHTMGEGRGPWDQWDENSNIRAGFEIE